MKKTIITVPSFEEEKILWNQGYKYIIGIDEVGRGSFAGPIVAAGVVLPSDFSATYEINDSKLLNPEKREELAVIIKKHALYYSIDEVHIPYINKYGIGKANQLAFRKVIINIKSKIQSIKYSQEHIASLRYSPDDFTYCLVDGFPVKGISKKYQKHIIQGDKHSITIAAASIIAKVYRDSLMRKLALNYPLYKFEENKGYGTLKHRETIKKYGLCSIHRKSFNLNKYL